jgi:hypothetical protein
MSKDKTSKIEKRQNVDRQNVEITQRSKDPKDETTKSPQVYVHTSSGNEKKKNCRKQKKEEKLHEIQFCIFTAVKTFYKLVKNEKKRRPNLT